MAKRNNMVFWIGLAGLTLYFVFQSGIVNAVTASGSMISDSQLQQIKNYESFKATAYPDGSDSSGNQLYSIGYGHQIQLGEQWLMTATLTEPAAEQLLYTDIQKTEDIINNSGINLTQNQFDALVDFGFSSGSGALLNAITVFINNGSQGVVDYLSSYVYWHPVPGGPAVVNQNLVNRRYDEVTTWNS